MVQPKKCLKDINWSKAIAKLVATSSFSYPIKGLQYFRDNRSFWPPLIAICIPAAAVSIIVFTLLSLFVFPIYALVVTIATGPLGFFAASLTLLQLSRHLTIMISQFLFIRHIQAAMFDVVLNREGAGELVARYKAMRNQHRPKRTLKLRLQNQMIPFLFREGFFFVLEIFPILGSVFVLCFRSPIKGYKTHKRYYKLMMWDYSQVNHFYREYQRDYMAFGLVALLLEMIPGLTILFMFTNNIGMALWTAQYHKDFEEFMREDATDDSDKEQEMQFWNNALGDNGVYSGYVSRSQKSSAENSEKNSKKSLVRDSEQSSTKDTKAE